MPLSRLTSSRPFDRLSVARTSGALEREGALATRGESATLQRDEALDAGGRKREHLVQPFALEGRLLCGPLHLDERPRAGHDDVHVHLGARVFNVVEVERGV